MTSQPALILSCVTPLEMLVGILLLTESGRRLIYGLYGLLIAQSSLFASTRSPIGIGNHCSRETCSIGCASVRTGCHHSVQLVS